LKVLFSSDPKNFHFGGFGEIPRRIAFKATLFQHVILMIITVNFGGHSFYGF